MKALVTGGAGFIGSNLVDELIAQGWKVIVLDNLSTGKREYVNSDAVFWEGSICDDILLEELFDLHKFDYIFHLAALARIQPSIDDPVTSNDVNLTGTLKLLNHARKSKVKKFVFAGSSSIYDDIEIPNKETSPKKPGSPYGYQKLACEGYIQLFQRLYGLNFGICRFFNVYGPRQITQGAYAAVVGIFLNQRKEGKPLTIFGDGSKRRDFTHVKDIVDGLIKTALYPDPIIVNLGTGTNISIKELADLVSPDQVFLENKDGEAEVTLCDRSLAKELIDWEPRYYINKEVVESLA